MRDLFWLPDESAQFSRGRRLVVDGMARVVQNGTQSRDITEEGHRGCLCVGGVGRIDAQIAGVETRSCVMALKHKTNISSY